METKFYKIGWLTYTQEELTWGQDKQIIDLFNQAKRRADADDSIDLGQIFNLFTKYDLLGVFLGIVLKPKNRIIGFFKGLSNLVRLKPYCFVDANKMHHSELVQVQQDFFLFNGKLANWLSGLLNGLGLIAQETTPTAGNGRASTDQSDPTRTKSESGGRRSNITPAAETRAGSQR